MDQGVPTAITIAAGVSFILANFPFVAQWFGTLTSQQKSIVIIVLMILIGLGTFISTSSVEALSNPANWLLLAQNILAAILSSQVFHTFVNKPLAPATTGSNDLG